MTDDHPPAGPTGEADAGREPDASREPDAAEIPATTADDSPPADGAAPGTDPAAAPDASTPAADAAVAEVPPAEVADAEAPAAEAPAADAAVADADAASAVPAAGASPPGGPTADASGAATTAPADRPPRRVPPALGYIGVAILGFVIGAGALAVASGGLGPGATPTPAPTPSAEPTAPPAGNEIGDLGAPVTIEVWADYQCPFCRLEDLLFGGAIEREYVIPGLVRVVYRDFAFLGQESADAAVAARCAGRQDPAAQLRFHDTLYTFQQGENQGRFVRENLIQMAEIAGVPDADAFEACLDDPAVAAEVEAEALEGRGVGIDSTPTMRLRGPGGERVLRGFSKTWPTVRDAIEAVLAPSPSPGSSPSPGGSPSAEPTPSGAPSPSAQPSASPSPTG